LSSLQPAAASNAIGPSQIQRPRNIRMTDLQLFQTGHMLSSTAIAGDCSRFNE
jgi:hypothetical protein